MLRPTQTLRLKWRENICLFVLIIVDVDRAITFHKELVLHPTFIINYFVALVQQFAEGGRRILHTLRNALNSPQTSQCPLIKMSKQTEKNLDLS